jgi:hypothetical protein
LLKQHNVRDHGVKVWIYRGEILDPKAAWLEARVPIRLTKLVLVKETGACALVANAKRSRGEE